MSHLTYLFGAGASKNALPIDDSLVKRMRDITTIGSNHPKELISVNYLNSFENRFIHILELASKEKSIDTLAKKLQYDEDLFYNIKNLIWIYFSIVAGKNKIDNRYTNLLLKVQDDSASSYRIKDNVSFITWNYDLQIAEAIANIDQIDIRKVAEKYYTYPGYELIKPDMMNRTVNPNLFKIVHLNGCAGYYRKEPDNSISHWCGCDLTDPIQYNNFINLIETNFYTNLSKPRVIKNSISFAFEDSYIKAQSLKFSKKIAAETTHLVIIGYSLPDFNKVIDSEILNEMKKLQYICIQNPNAEKIKTKLLGISSNIGYKNDMGELNIHIESEDMNEFHLPPDIF
jgi:hypothetical protein